MLRLIFRCDDSNFPISIASNNRVDTFPCQKKNQAQLKLVKTSYSNSEIQKVNN